VAEILVEFDPSQSIGALREAAYRLIGEASCQINTVGDRYTCWLIPKGAQTDDAIRTRFLDLVTDENLREKVAVQTAPLRDVIVALAFGALAREREGTE
jgi:His-Xaa-Ser system protein HxsD